MTRVGRVRKQRGIAHDVDCTVSHGVKRHPFVCLPSRWGRVTIPICVAAAVNEIIPICVAAAVNETSTHQKPGSRALPP